MQDPHRPYDLAILGAGIAGLNALFVASRHLSSTARIALIDRRDGAGGMWRSVYPYVRLHQPHPMFTAGNIPWDWDRPRAYLATGAEVRAHLEHCLATLADGLTLETHFGTEAGEITETATHAEIALPSGPLRAAKFIDARGLNVPDPQPLALTSENVLSLTPADLADLPEGTPVAIAGGGKTGLDTAAMLIRRGHPVTLIDGAGTVFADRDQTMPARRWRDGQLVLSTFRDIATRFDGDNEDAVANHFRDTYGVTLDGRGRQYFFALLSRAEAAEIASGLAATWPGYLADVTDGPDGPVALFRDGTTRPLAPGTAIINCTGALLRGATPYRPYLSPLGRVCTVTPRSAVSALPSYGAYFLTHHFLRDTLRGLPLYELDAEALLPHGRALWQATMMTHTFHNILPLTDGLPMKAIAECGIDMDRWYPMPRRLLELVRIKTRQKALMAHARATLDRVRERTGVRCGPLPS
ncbi:FAD-dependent oxidoreductase [Rhodobacterales bacterium HKCCE2091]|nr:FAD-dependent oxidoreductase [Rhodobacterales bacterium HKCCE2091]